eukprot:1161664-Pelagomonas_calceolata.AAC.11
MTGKELPGKRQPCVPTGGTDESLNSKAESAVCFCKKPAGWRAKTFIKGTNAAMLQVTMGFHLQPDVLAASSAWLGRRE